MKTSKCSGKKGWFRHMMIMTASVCIGIIGLGAATAVYGAEPVQYLDPAHPDEMQSIEGYNVLTNDSAQLSKEWYVVREDIEFTDRVVVNRTDDKSVNLVLCDGVTMTALQGIQVTSGQSLTIWAQSDGEDMGVLDASVTDSEYAAAIGGGAPAEAMEDAVTDPNAGMITINGGRISAVSAASEGSNVSPASAIGAGRCWADPYIDGGSAGHIYINGGDVTAESTGGGGGIGHMIDSYNRVPEGKQAGTITIKGGTVTASGLYGLGGPGHAPAATINIRGGEITAESRSTVDEDAVHGKVDVSGGILTAIAGSGEGSKAFDGETVEAGKSIILDRGIKVTVGDDADSAAAELVKPEDKRAESMWSAKWARTEECDHGQVEVTGETEQTVTVKCDYCGVEGSFGRPSLTIDCDGADTSMGKNPIYYANGEAISPDVTVTSGGTDLIEGKDYQISYQDLISKGTCEKPAGEGSYKMIVSGKGMYKGFIEGEQIFFIRAETPEKGMIVFWSCNNNEEDPCQIRIAGTGESVGNIEQPSFTGHTFRGWYTDKPYTEENEFDLTEPVDMADWETKELNVYAVWTHPLKFEKGEAANCTKDGVKDCYKCSEKGCGALFEDENGTRPIRAEDLVIPVGPHQWGEPSYKWAEDHSQATASCSCIVCKAPLTESVMTVKEITKQPTCKAEGEATYTAVFNKEAFETQTETVILEPLKEHVWDEGTITREATTTEEGQILYTCTSCGDTRTESIPMIEKKAQSMTAKGKTVKVKAKTLKKKKKTIARKKAMTVKGAKGTVTYTKVKVSKKKYAGKFTINKKTGKITVKKGVKKGTYKLTVKIAAAGDDTYKAAAKKAVVTIRVR